MHNSCWKNPGTAPAKFKICFVVNSLGVYVIVLFLFGEKEGEISQKIE